MKHPGHPNYHELGAFTGDATPVQQEELRAAYARIAVLETALNQSFVAIDDWLHSYAPDHCNAQDVAETKKRLSEYGTLWYIASIQKKIRETLRQPFPGEGAWSL